MKQRWEGNVENPLLPIIREAIEGLDGSTNSFVILSRSGSGLTYLQVHGDVSDGFELEYQEGSTDEHYECIDELSQEDIVNAFQAYRSRNETWKLAYEWKKRRLA